MKLTHVACIGVCPDVCHTTVVVYSVQYFVMMSFRLRLKPRRVWYNLFKYFYFIFAKFHGQPNISVHKVKLVFVCASAFVLYGYAYVVEWACMHINVCDICNKYAKKWGELKQEEFVLNILKIPDSFNGGGIIYWDTSSILDYIKNKAMSHQFHSALVITIRSLCLSSIILRIRQHSSHNSNCGLIIHTKPNVSI